MLTEGPGDENLATLLSVVLKVAQLHGSPVALSDLVKLLPADMATKDIEVAFETLPTLPGNYVLKDGLLVPGAGNHPLSNDFSRNLQHSIANIKVARWLSSALGSRQALTIAVSGSTSYKAASPRDDLDLFCVTRSHTMWLFLAKALLLARASMVFGRSDAPICVSCLMDEGYAKSLFAKDGGALFARDALVVEVVLGHDQYASLLDSAPWMKKYFPKLYAGRSTNSSIRANSRTKSLSWSRCVNLFLFITLGSYIRAKARFHNHVLARQGKSMSLFRARVGPDHLIYESAKYTRLKEIYKDIRPSSKDFRMGTGKEDPAPIVSSEPGAR